MSRKFKSHSSLLNISNGFSFTSRRNCPVETSELLVDCDIYRSPNQKAVSLRAVQLKNLFLIRHISVRYTRQLIL